MRKVILLLLFFSTHAFYAQSISLLQKGDTLQRPRYQQFIYLSDSTDIAPAIFVAKIKCRGSLKHTTNLYYFIRNEAQRLGANAYKFESFTKTDNGVNGELVLSAYFCEEAVIDANFEHLPKNKIFVFGDDDLTGHKLQGYKVKGTKCEIDSGQFKAIDIKPNEEIKLTKGGFTGMTLWFKRKEGGFSSYLTFSGFGLSGSTFATGYNGGIGLSFNTGNINNVDSDLALVLLKIYQEHQ